MTVITILANIIIIGDKSWWILTVDHLYIKVPWWWKVVCMQQGPLLHCASIQDDIVIFHAVQDNLYNVGISCTSSNCLSTIYGIYIAA